MMSARSGLFDRWDGSEARGAVALSVAVSSSAEPASTKSRAARVLAPLQAAPPTLPRPSAGLTTYHRTNSSPVPLPVHELPPTRRPWSTGPDYDGGSGSPAAPSPS